MDISIVEHKLQKFIRPSGSLQTKSGGLRSPERSGSPDLEGRRSSQRYRSLHLLAYTFKEDAHQDDDWPGAPNRRIGIEDERDRACKGSSPLDTINWQISSSQRSTPSPPPLRLQRQEEVPRALRINGLEQTADESADAYPQLDFEDGCVSPLGLLNIEKHCILREKELEAVRISLEGAQNNGIPSASLINMGPHTKHHHHETRDADDPSGQYKGLAASMGYESNINNRPEKLNHNPDSSQLPCRKVFDEQGSMRMSWQYYAKTKEACRVRRTSYQSVGHLNTSKPQKLKSEEIDESSTSSMSQIISDDGRCDDEQEAAERARQMILEKYLLMRPERETIKPHVHTPKLFTGSHKTFLRTKELLQPTNSLARSPYKILQVKKRKPINNIGRDQQPSSTNLYEASSSPMKQRYYQGSGRKPCNQSETLTKTSQINSPGNNNSMSAGLSPHILRVRKTSPLKHRSQGPPAAGDYCNQPVQIPEEGWQVQFSSRSPFPTIFSGKFMDAGDFPHSKALEERFEAKDKAQTEPEELCRPETCLQKEESTDMIEPQAHLEVEFASTLKCNLGESLLVKEDAGPHHEEIAHPNLQIPTEMDTLITTVVPHECGTLEEQPISPRQIGCEIDLELSEVQLGSPRIEQAENLDERRLCLTECPDIKLPNLFNSEGIDGSDGIGYKRQIGNSSPSKLLAHVHVDEEHDHPHGPAKIGVGNLMTSTISDPIERLPHATEEIGAPLQTPDLKVEEFAQLPNHRNSAEVDEPIQQSSPSNKTFLELMKKVTAAVCIEPGEDDEVLPVLSLAAHPAIFKVPELQKKVEELRHQLAEEKRQRQLVAQCLTEQRRDAEKLAQKTYEHWNLKVRELQQEKDILSTRLQELEEKQKPCNKIKANLGEKLHLTAEEVQKLHQEILEQEALIRGYQHENEKAVNNLKEVKLVAKEKIRSMAEENAALSSQLANMHLQGGHQNWGYNGVETISLKEKLQGALSREFALRVEIDKMKDAHLELEKRVLEGESIRIKDLEVKITALEETLASERQGHAQIASTIDGKMEAMSQLEELIASLQATVADQAAQIQSLTNKPQDGSQSTFQDHIPEVMHKEAALKHIECLHNQVKKNEATLRKEKKDMTSLQGLHQVSKAELEAIDEVQQLRAELVAAQRHAILKDEETNRILHNMKLEMDKLRHESSTRIRNLKQQMQAQAHQSATGTGGEMSRVKELEKQVANIRVHYSRKLKVLTDKVEESKSEVFVQNKLPTTESIVRPPARKHINSRPTMKEKDLKEPQEQIVQHHHQDTHASSILAPSPPPAMIPISDTEKQSEGISFAHVKSEIEKQKCATTELGLDTSKHSVGEMVALRKELEISEKAREMPQKVCAESVEKTVMFTLQHQQAFQLHNMHRNQMRHNADCQKSPTTWLDSGKGILEGHHINKDVTSLEMANCALEARLMSVSKELEEAYALCRQSPRMAQIINLKRKVAEMEARQHQKEMEWQEIVQESRRQVCNTDEERGFTQHKEAFDAQEAEVERFRRELSDILDAAGALVQQSQTR